MYYISAIDPDGTGFRCTMMTDSPDAPMVAVTVTADVLQHYFQFQRVVLERLGFLFVLNLCDPHPEHMADHFWRQYTVGYFLNRPRPDSPPTAAPFDAQAN